jgi:hypothetical protein
MSPCHIRQGTNLTEKESIVNHPNSITIETIHHNPTPQDQQVFSTDLAATLRRVQRKAALAAKFYTTCHGNNYWQYQQKLAAAGATHAELAEWIRT